MAWLGGIWSDVYTSRVAGFRRLKTENSDSSFDEGNIFRAFWELNLSSGATRVFKFTLSDDVILLSSNIDIDDGGISYEVYSGGVESGVFTPIQEFKTNLTSGTPSNTSNAKISTGGALDVSSAIRTDLTRVLSANANSKQSTVGSIDGDMRGFPATTAYVVIKNLAGVSGSSKGTIKWLWKNK